MKGTVKIDGVDYSVEVRDGERFIDGKTVDEFFDTLPLDTMRRLAKVGEFVIDEALSGDAVGATDAIYQEKLSELEFLDY